jgi:diguanylate cyclase (GGDEF)-like protein
LSGLLWSTIGIYLLNTFDSSEQLYILLILGALAAGAVATDIVMLSVYFAFVISATLPITLFLLVSGSSQMILSGVLLAIFVVFITSSAFRLNRLVAESLSYQFDNLQLLDELEQEKSQVIRLYSNLEFDLANRKKTEEQLKIEKEKAEELARSLLSISTLDGLTGIPNRRHFDSTLAKEWNRASRSNTPLSLIMCDIDYFKSYNDHYGHQKGDNCLIQVATVLQEHARRDDDMAARYGGEEFAIILPTTDLSNAKEIAEQMRMAIINLAIPHRYSSTENIVTASFGIATVIPEKEQQSKTLLALADRALYKAKQQGRNNVATTTPEVVSGNPDASGDINEAS